MEELISYKSKSLGYRTVGDTVGSYTYINGVMSGLTIKQDAPDTTEIEHEFTDQNLEEWDTLKPLIMEFDLVKFSPDQIVELMGGSYNASTGLWSAPISAPRIRKEIKLSFWEGIDYWVIYNAKVTSNWDGSDLKKAPLKLHITLKALANGSSPSNAQHYFPAGVEVDTLAVSTIAATTATANYYVTLTDGGAIAKKGVCYARHDSPQLTDTKVEATSGVGGASTASLTGLTASTTYYVRAYTLSSAGEITWGDVVSFTTLAA